MKPRNLHRQQRQVSEPSSLPSQRSTFLIFSALSGLFFGYVWWTVSPSEAQNTLVSNSYLPMILAVFLFTFSLIGMFTKAKRALTYSAVFTLFIFLRLHQIQGAWLLPALLFPVLISDVILTYRKTT